MILQSSEGRQKLKAGKTIITGFHIVYYLRWPLYQGTIKGKGVVVWSRVINNLFPRWFREVDSGLREKSKAASSSCSQTTHLPPVAAVSGPCTLQTSLQSQSWCTHKGIRGSVDVPSTIHSELLFPSLPSDFLRYSFELFSLLLCFPILRKWLQNYYQDRVFYFTF